jgi:hypothetical protein
MTPSYAFEQRFPGAQVNVSMMPLVANVDTGRCRSDPGCGSSCDAVTSIFMFHELPPAARCTVFREFARVLKPGGRFMLVDSVQRGDRLAYDGLLDLFPLNYHEPYYSTYITEKFEEIGRASGLTYVRNFSVFVSKVWCSSRGAGPLWCRSLPRLRRFLDRRRSGDPPSCSFSTASFEGR